MRIANCNHGNIDKCVWRSRDANVEMLDLWAVDMLGKMIEMELQEAGSKNTL